MDMTVETMTNREVIDAMKNNMISYMDYINAGNDPESIAGRAWVRTWNGLNDEATYRDIRKDYLKEMMEEG